MSLALAKTKFRAQAALASVAIIVFSSSGCVRQLLVNSAADLLSQGGSGGAIARDEDPELVAEALPFTLKTMESLLEETPHHQGLLTALSSGFTQYAQGFVLPQSYDADFREADRIEKRAKRLHLRAHRYGMRALGERHHGFGEALEKKPNQAAQGLSKDDIEAMYWTGASLMAAVALSTDDMATVAELPKAEALLQCALELDPDWGEGSIHEIVLAYEGRSETLGGSAKRSQAHFAKAVELTKGLKLSPYVSLAEAVAVPSQDRKLFDRLIAQALEIDIEAAPEYRLANEIARRRALWLQTHAEDLIL